MELCLSEPFAQLSYFINDVHKGFCVLSTAVDTLQTDDKWGPSFSSSSLHILQPLWGAGLLGSHWVSEEAEVMTLRCASLLSSTQKWDDHDPGFSAPCDTGYYKCQLTGLMDECM